MKFLKNNKALTIREAQPEDAEEILKVLKIIGGESDFLVIDGNGVPMTVEQEKEYLERNLKSFNNKTFIGIVDGKIIATCGLTANNRERVKHNVVIGISILKDFWNLGVGTHLMEYMVNYCHVTKEIRNIELEVRADNVHAIRLYEKLGFKYVGKFTDKMKIGDKYYDNLIYELVTNH